MTIVDLAMLVATVAVVLGDALVRAAVLPIGYAPLPLAAGLLLWLASSAAWLPLYRYVDFSRAAVVTQAMRLVLEVGVGAALFGDGWPSPRRWIAAALCIAGALLWDW